MCLARTQLATFVCSGDMRPAVDSEASTSIPVIYLRCPANVTVSSLKKLIRSKYDLSNHFLVSDCTPV